MLRFARVTGKVGMPFGGPTRERYRSLVMPPELATGVEMVPLSRIENYRTGEEKLVPAPKGAKCRPDYHNLKEGAQVYDLGSYNGKPTFACQIHFPRIPKLEGIIRKYSAIRYQEIIIEDKETGQRLL